MNSLKSTSYSLYYQAQIISKDVWLVVATLRSFEHLVFDRTLDKNLSIFEFFVPESQEAIFVEFLNHFKSIGLIVFFKKLPNRLLDEQALI